MGQLNTLLNDGYDREVVAQALATHPPLAQAAQALARLLPHGGALAEDLFFAVFKLNAVLVPAEELSVAVLINRRLVAGVLAAAALEQLRQRTALDPVTAATAAARLAEQVLSTLKTEFRFDAQSLVQASEAALDEQELDALLAQRKQLDSVDELPSDTRQDMRDALDRDIKSARSRRSRSKRKQAEIAANLSKNASTLGDALERLPQQLEAAESHAKGLGVGGDGQVDSAKRLELGERIARSSKLRRLAQIVGAFKEVAFEARRARTTQWPQELHTVTCGNELEQLLPAELLGLQKRNAALRPDFLRRYSERQLSQYHLHAPANRGPMVICLDGSGSMQGKKELWSKAVALTLMDIARRQKRGCLGLIFSSSAQLFEVELLAKSRLGGRAKVRDEALISFAEHFPSGGTDFEAPLQRAVDAVTTGNFRRGDIVFITDGQAAVSETLIERIRVQRKRHRFRIYGVLVDLDDHRTESLARFSDEVRTVTDLTSDAMTQLFAAV
ncbi:MAG: VWA domain-containing protein [Gammaproteobacteria bacterium]|nr:VWA domain-containing protein [Gammaproteobacteria bacterium]